MVHRRACVGCTHVNGLGEKGKPGRVFTEKDAIRSILTKQENSIHTHIYGFRAELL